MPSSFKNVDTVAICPVSGLPVRARPEWTDRGFGRGYRVTVRVIGRRILLVRPSGHARADSVDRTLALTGEIIRDNMDPSAGFVQLMDYSRLRSISRNGRLRYIDHVAKRKNLLGLIYYNVNPLFRLMIKFTIRLGPGTVDVHIAKDYTAAVHLAMALLGGEPAGRPKNAPVVDYAALGITEHHEAGRHILRCDSWNIAFDDYSVSVEVIDGRIYHARSSGILCDHHIEGISRLRERVREMLRLENGFPAIVTGATDNHAGNRKARKKYMDSLKKWHEQYPMALYVFYNANWFIRSAAMLAIPFMPFPVKISHDLSGAMGVVDRFTGTVPTDAPKKLSPESEAEDPQHVVHQLLQFIGDIEWDRRGAAKPGHVPADHPFRPVFDAVALVKGELDELFEERRLAEQRLVESQRRFDEVLKFSRDVLYKRDLRTGTVDYVSDAVEDLLEIPSEVVRRDGLDGVKQLIHPEDLPRFDGFIQSLMGNTAPPNGEPVIEYRVKNRQGEYRWFSDSITVVRDDGGEPAYIIGSSRDVSRIKKLELERLKVAEQLQHSRKLEAVHTMAGGVAHNFNNLLTVVLGNLEMMRLETPAGSRLHRNISTAEKSAQRAAELGALLLTYLGQGEMNPQDFDLHTIVSEMVDVLKKSFAGRATLVLAPADSATWINADPANVCQVINNLVANAVEASEDRPPIIQLTVGSRFCDAAALTRLETGGEELSPGRYSWLQISDNGGGMDREILDKVFDPFFTTKFTGRGLGMATVLGVMRAHQGGVFVESWKGKGTTVIVYFPAPDPEDVEKSFD